jgi:hypothetical protein
MSKTEAERRVAGFRISYFFCLIGAFGSLLAVSVIQRAPSY